MKLGTIVKTSFVISVVIILVGAYQKINHAAGTETWLIIGILASPIFILAAIYEVQTSKKIGHSEKTMWTLAFIFFSSIAGLVYILIGRKRIAEKS